MEALMKRFVTALAALVVLLGAGTPAFCATVVRFTHPQLNFPSGTSVTDIGIDEANRVWFTTNFGVTALSGATVATGFPLSALSLKGYSDLSSVAFGPVNGEASIQENFFLGSNATIKSGLIYGRMLTSPTFGTGFELGQALVDAGGSTGWGQVNALAASADAIWTATNDGLARVEIPNIGILINDSLRMTSPVLRVVAADEAVSGGSAFFSTSLDVYLVRADTQTASKLHFQNLSLSMGNNAVGGLAVDGTGNLWVAEANGVGTPRRIFFYPAANLLAWAQSPGTVAEPEPQVALFNPGAANSVYTTARNITDLAVNPLTGDVWVATTAGAFFQETAPAAALFGQKLCGLGTEWPSPADDVDAAAVVCDEVNRGWHPMPQRQSETQQAAAGGQGGESVSAVFLDSVGNAWLGSDKSIRGIIARSLSLSGNRFIGVGARAQVFLNDDIQAGQAVSVRVTVGGAAAEIPLVLDEAGNGTIEFGFTYSASDPTVAPHRFTVTSSAAGIPITVTYDYTNSLGEPASLVAIASWAEIVEFEDDLWIGGPCFLRSLEPR